jgi:hypothetical protein
MKRGSYATSILIAGIVTFSLAGCTRKIYVPDPLCNYSIEIREKKIDELVEKMDRLHEKLKDCQRELSK